MIQNFGEKLMSILPEIEGEELKKKIKDDKEYIQYSISCGMSWKYVDLAKHAIGTLKDIMEFAVTLLNNENTGNLLLSNLDVNNFISKIYRPC